MSLVITPIDFPSGIEEFAEAPPRIRDAHYARGVPSPKWTTDLLRFDFAFARAHWLAREGGKIVGRIGANVSTGDLKRGFIGFYECALDHPNRERIHTLLLTTAEAWLRERGVTEAFGPIDYQTWFPYRFRTKAPAGTPDFFRWEPVQPDAYPELWTKSGYQPVDRYATKCTTDLIEASAALKPHYERGLAAGFTVRPFRLGAEFAQELPIIQEINRQSFKPGFLTEAIDPRAYAKLYVPQFADLVDAHSFFAVSPEGKEVGYFFNYADQGHLIWKTAAVISDYQRLGVAAFAGHHGLALGIRSGLKFTVAALMKEGAASEGLAARSKAHAWSHEYAVFRKTL